MRDKCRGGFLIAAVNLLCCTISVHGGHVTRGNYQGPAHAMMRRDSMKERGKSAESHRSHSFSAGGKNIPSDMAKQMKDRDREWRKIRLAQSSQALKTAADQEKKYVSSMWNDTSTVPIVSMQEMEGSHYRMKGVPGRIVINLVARPSETSHNRLTHLLTWLQRQSANNHADHLVVISDGYSLLNGGCSDKDLHDRYGKLVSEADAKVVMGVELGPATLDPEFVAAFDRQRTQVLEGQKLPEALYENLASCEGEACKIPTKYQYPDVGFIMGPVADVHRVLQGIQFSFTKRFSHDMSERLATMDYMIENPRQVALDYGSKLVLSLHDFRQSNSVLKITPGKLQNSVVDDAQCFVHAAGDKYDWALDLSSMLRDQK